METKNQEPPPQDKEEEEEEEEMKTQTQPPPPPQDKEEEEENDSFFSERVVEVKFNAEEEIHSFSSETPPNIFKSYNSPALFQSPSPSFDSPPHATYHTNEFRVTPSHTNSASPPIVPPETFRAEPKVVETRPHDAKRRTLRPSLSVLKRSRRESMVRRALFGLRISGFVFCLISFSVMAADKKQGWALDSYNKYKEFRYCLAVNVIGFVYSGLQTYDLANFFTTGKHLIQHHLRYYFDFFMDQILTYLLISASSSAAVRADDWESNWGKDTFPDMARASVALSFLAFVAFASSSLISGYTICTLKSI